MKIALLSTPFVRVPPRDYGGTELVIHELVEGLVERGHDVTLFATGDSETAARLGFLYETPRWPPAALADLNHASWAFASIVRDGYDVVHAHTAEALAMTRLAPAVPVVYTLHHERDEACSAYYPYFPAIWYVAISDRQRQREVRLPRITRIYHGLEPGRYGGPTRAGEYVCFIGRLSQIKGPHTAIDAAEKAGVEIRVAGASHGDDTDRGFYDREVVPRLGRPNVRYLGPVGMAEKVRLLLGARAALAPLEWEEPFGLSILEALMCGCPVIAFPRGSAPELIEDGRTGFLARDAAELVEILRTRLDGFDREACRQRAAERFGRGRMVEEYDQYYRLAHEIHRRESPHSVATAG